MKTAILCGGRGTRLREVSETMPKPMVPVGGRPIVWHIMKIYAHFGVTEFVLLLGYKGEVIRDFFLNYASFASDVTVDLSRSGTDRLTFHKEVSEDWKVTLVDTGLDAMTGARLRRARHHLDDDDCFMATYGDGVGDVDIAGLLSFHKAHGRTATLTGVYPPGRFGELEVENGAVAAFNEKPQVSGGRINGGFFVFNRNFLEDYLDDDEGLVLEQAPMQGLSRDRELHMFEHNGFWMPMDTPREHSLLNDLWAKKTAPWRKWDV